MNEAERLMAVPLHVRGYFITFTTYGARLHGDASGSVDSEHRVYRTSACPPDPAREEFEGRRMIQPEYILDAERRKVVLRSCREVCEFRRWWLFVAHVRSNHVHLVVQASDRPERVMNALKSYSSRALTKAGFEGRERRRWARHGSTRYLWNDDELRSAINYVLCEQGERMEVYIAPDRWKETEPRP